ncbi:MAG: hypothetical protein IKT61_04810 [Clostridia bacterium]|nr:hypothetical protein [Clostridia bacterium]
MSMFKKGKASAPLTQKAILENRYKSSILNILLVLGFTTVNVVLLLLNSNTYFLFSAFLPYLAVDYGMYFCGLYPEEYYYGDEVFLNKSFLFFMVAVAAIMLAIYLISWICARKKKVGWLIAAFVFFAIDTAAMLVLTEIGTDSIIDIVFHVWVLISMGMGIHAFYKMKKLPEEEPVAEAFAEATPTTDETAEPMNSVVLRMADEAEKARVFVEADYEGSHIVFRRVKRTNELVINGMVYDEYEALAESAHTLSAVVDGRKFEVVFDGFTNVFIFVNGQELAKAKRLY